MTIPVEYRKRPDGPFCKNYLPIPSQCNAMEKDCIVTKIEASQDGSPYMYVTFSDPDNLKPGAERPQNPFGPMVILINII
jgi:hypothetical protein